MSDYGTDRYCSDAHDGPYPYSGWHYWNNISPPMIRDSREERADIERVARARAAARRKEMGEERWLADQRSRLAFLRSIGIQIDGVAGR